MGKRENTSGKLLWQYYGSYLLVMLTVMVLLLVYAYESFHRFHTEILLTNYENSLNLVRETHETELSRLVSISGQLTALPDVSPFVFEEEPEKAIRLTNLLRAYSGSSDFIRGLYFRFYGDNYIFSSTSSYLMDNFINHAANFDGITGDELVWRLNTTTQLTVLPEQSVRGYLFNTQDVSKRVVPVFVPVVYSSGVRCGTALYLIDRQTYVDMFNSLALDNCDVYILSGDEVLLPRAVSGVPEQAVMQAAEDGRGQLRHEGGTYHVIELPGKTMRYRYIMLVSDEEMAVAMVDTLKVFVLVAAVVFLLGLLLITRLVHSRLKPIRLLHSMLLDQESTGNELLEIRDSVQRLIDEHAQLSSELVNVETLKKSDFAHKFLKGSFENEDEWLAMAEEIRVNVDTRFFAVCILAKPADSEYELAPDKLNHLFDEDVSGVSRTMSLQDRVAMVAFADDCDRLLTWFAGKFAGMRACCPGITMAISTVHSDYREGPLAYLEAENAFESRFVRGNAEVIPFQAQWNERSDAGANQQVVDRLRMALRAGDVARVRSALDDVSHVMRGMNMSLFGFRCMYNEILSVITSEMRGGAAWGREVYDIFSLSQCLSLDDLDSMLYKACSRLIDERNEDARGEPQAPEAVAEAMQIIRQRFYDPDLSVSAIAQAVGMSDSKLSVEFGKAYKMKPLEYLTMQRMHRACRLLLTTDMPVKDIAVECGYYEISGFNRRFKAYTGTTPRQYRQRNDEKTEEGNGELSHHGQDED